MKENYNRRNFIRMAAVAGAGLTLSGNLSPLYAQDLQVTGKRVGIIGLDTSHCIAQTKSLNNPKVGSKFSGYKVVAAFPTAGSSDIPASINRLAGFTEQIREQGVEIVNSIEELLKKVDVVLLETVDGRKHLEQALPVLKAGKPLFIDKPISASLGDTLAIFKAAKKYNVPTFSSSSLRYMQGATDALQGKVGKVLGADTFSPAILEKTHPDLFWYGIHGVEILFTVMGTGCKNVVRVHTDNADIVIGT